MPTGVTRSQLHSACARARRSIPFPRQAAESTASSTHVLYASFPATKSRQRNVEEVEEVEEEESHEVSDSGLARREGRLTRSQSSQRARIPRWLLAPSLTSVSILQGRLQVTYVREKGNFECRVTSMLRQA